MYMYIQNVQQNNSRSYKWNKMLLTPNCLPIMYKSFVRRKYEHLTSFDHEWCWKKNFTLRVHVPLCLTLWQCVIAMNHFIIQYSHGGTSVYRRMVSCKCRISSPCITCMLYQPCPPHLTLLFMSILNFHCLCDDQTSITIFYNHK